MCGKRPYDTRGEAKQSLRRHHGHSYKGCRPYFCSECGAYHLGHLPADVRHGLVDRWDVYGARA